MKSNISANRDFEMALGAYAWMILPDGIEANTEHLNLVECLAALHVQGAHAQGYVLERGIQHYRLIILSDRVVDAPFRSVFARLVKHLNTIAYGFIELREQVDFQDFISSLIGGNLHADRAKFSIRQAEEYEQLAVGHTNYARYLRDQMGKQVLARFT